MSRPILLVFLLLLIVFTSQIDWNQQIVNEVEANPNLSRKQLDHVSNQDSVKEKMTSENDSITQMLPKDDPSRKPKTHLSDPGWKYAFWPDLTRRDKVECVLCGKHIAGGITRFKKHLAGNYGDVTMCPKTTRELRKEMLEALLVKQRNKKVVTDLDDDDDDDVPELHSMADSNSKMASSGTATKQKKGPMFNFVKPSPPPEDKGKSVVQMLRKSPEDVIKDRHDKSKQNQMGIEAYTKRPEEKERVFMHISNFFYENGIPFNAAHSLSYEIMMESVGQYGPGLIPPSYHELRVPLLEKAKKNTAKLQEGHEKAWEKYGCTLMADGWTDRRQRHLINFLVNSPEGTFFLGSVNASNQSHDATMLADLRVIISDQVDEYENSRGSFARETLLDLRKKKRPLDWWSGYAGRTRELQKFAKRIVGLCCSSSGCERNWSTFEFIHTKRRNRLEWQRLNDLVYVQYNRKITTRYEKMRISGKGFDPLVIEEFQWENEWVVDDPLWHQVDDITGASNAIEPRNFRRGDHPSDITYTRRRARDTDVPSSRSHDEPNSDGEMDEDSVPIDDEEVEDDFGAPSTSHESGGRKGGGNDGGDDLMLDDYV